MRPGQVLWEGQHEKLGDSREAESEISSQEAIAYSSLNPIMSVRSPCLPRFAQRAEGENNPVCRVASWHSKSSIELGCSSSPCSQGLLAGT